MAHQFITHDTTKEAYCQIFNVDDGKVWDANAGAMAAIAGVTWANTVVTVAWDSDLKIDTLTLPSDLPTGYRERYDIRVFDVAPGSAADSDYAAGVWRVEFSEENRMETSRTVVMR